MTEETFQKLRDAIQQADVPEATRNHLLELVTAAQNEPSSVEVDQVEPDQEDTAPPQGIRRLIASLEGLEATHPEATDLINGLAMGLSKMGF